MKTHLRLKIANWRLLIGLWTLAIGLWTASAQTTPMWFTNELRTGTTNDVTYSFVPQQGVSILNGIFYTLTNASLTTTNGVGEINLIPGPYTASINGQVYTWTQNVPQNFGLPVNAALWATNLVIYSGIAQIIGVNGIAVSPILNGGTLYITNTGSGSGTSGFNTIQTTNGQQPSFSLTTIYWPTNDYTNGGLAALGTNATNEALLIGLQGTNNTAFQVATLGTNSSNYSLTIGLNGTNNTAFQVATLGTNSSNYSLTIGLNGTNNTAFQVATLGTNSSNYSLTIGLNGTNNTAFQVATLGTNSSNYSLTIGLNGTNNTAFQVATLGTNSTNESLLIGLQGSNNTAFQVATLGTNSSNYSLTIGLNGTNNTAFQVATLGTNSSNYSLTIGLNGSNNTASQIGTLGSQLTNYANAQGGGGAITTYSNYQVVSTSISNLFTPTAPVAWFYITPSVIWFVGIGTGTNGIPGETNGAFYQLNSTIYTNYETGYFLSNSSSSFVVYDNLANAKNTINGTSPFGVYSDSGAGQRAYAVPGWVQLENGGVHLGMRSDTNMLAQINALVAIYSNYVSSTYLLSSGGFAVNLSSTPITLKTGSTTIGNFGTDTSSNLVWQIIGNPTYNLYFAFSNNTLYAPFFAGNGSGLTNTGSTNISGWATNQATMLASNILAQSNATFQLQLGGLGANDTNESLLIGLQASNNTAAFAQTLSNSASNWLSLSNVQFQLQLGGLGTNSSNFTLSTALQSSNNTAALVQTVSNSASNWLSLSNVQFALQLGGLGTNGSNYAATLTQAGSNYSASLTQAGSNYSSSLVQAGSNYSSSLAQANSNLTAAVAQSQSNQMASTNFAVAGGATLISSDQTNSFAFTNFTGVAGPLITNGDFQWFSNAVFTGYSNLTTLAYDQNTNTAGSPVWLLSTNGGVVANLNALSPVGSYVTAGGGSGTNAWGAKLYGNVLHITGTANFDNVPIAFQNAITAYSNAAILNFASRLAGFATNFTMVGPNNVQGISVTNVNGTNLIESLWGIGTGGSAGMNLSYDGVMGDADYGGQYLNPQHDGADSPNNFENQNTSPHNYMWGCAYGPGNTGHFQMGAAIAVGNGWFFFNDMGVWPLSASVLPLYSMPVVWKCSVVQNGGRVFAPHEPGIWSQMIGTNSWQLTIFSDFPDANNWTTNQMPFHSAFYAGTNQGLEVNGGLRFARTVFNPGTTNFAFDFGRQQLIDINAGANTNVTVYATNSFENSGWLEPRVLIIRAGGNAITVNGSVNWAGWTNANVPAANLLRVAMESVGPGDTNKLVTGELVLPDNSFSPDPLFYAYSARAGVTNWAVNTLLTSLRSAGLIDPNGACYPMLVGSNACIQNAFSSSYQITVHGAVYFTNGFKGDGSTGYGDTGLIESTATGWTTGTNFTVYGYVGTNGHTLSSNARPISTADGANHWCGIIYNSIHTWNDAGANDFSPSEVGGTITTPDFAIWRTNGFVKYGAIAGGIQTFAQNTNGVPNVSFYIGARNGAGSPDFFYGGPVKFALFLSFGLTNTTQWTSLTNAVYQYENAQGNTGL